MSKPGLILQHDDTGPPARFGDWLDDRGLAFEVCPIWRRPPPDPAGYAFVASLGAVESAADTDNWVPSEIAALRAAIAADVPVLGMCFGGQALAVALGGEVTPLDVPEVGWVALEVTDSAIPGGPWVEYHRDRIVLPPGATELARSPAGPAAFRHGRHLGLQFHPEADAELVDQWARADTRLGDAGVTVEQLAAQGAAHSAPALDAAHRLFDGWLAAARA